MTGPKAPPSRPETSAVAMGAAALAHDPFAGAARQEAVALVRRFAQLEGWRRRVVRVGAGLAGAGSFVAAYANTSDAASAFFSAVTTGLGLFLAGVVLSAPVGLILRALLRARCQQSELPPPPVTRAVVLLLRRRAVDADDALRLALGEAPPS